MKKVLFTSYICSKDEILIQDILSNWKLLNPNFDILYFSDSDVHDFFENTAYFNIYKQMKNGVAIADLFRICYINKHGGFWFDIDIEPFKVIIRKEHAIQLFDCGYGNISYMFIGGLPNQTLFNNIITKVIDNIENNIPDKTQCIMDITGPRIIQNIILNKMNIENTDGNFKAPEIPQIYLTDTDCEFCYNYNKLTITKTAIYNELQVKYNRKHHAHYTYI